MGFNPRLAPYSMNRTFTVWFGTATTIQTYDVDLFRFPFAGQLLSAYGNIQSITPAGGTVPAAISADVTTRVELMLWKATADDTTATYATAARAAARTAGPAWGLAPTTAVPGLYLLTNKSAARRKFALDDRLLANVGGQAATNANRTYEVRVQMNYVVGAYES